MQKYLPDHFPQTFLGQPLVLGMDSAALEQDLRRHFTHTLGRNSRCRSMHHFYEALALTLRDRLMERWNNTRETYRREDCRQTYYLSLEYLMGRLLRNASLSLGLDDPLHQLLEQLGSRLEAIAETENDAGLGNGGLGRLAACFLDSCATLQLPVVGYGIRYHYGMFRQRIDRGYQVEEPDHWLRDGYPWEVERAEFTQRVRFRGHTEDYQDSNGTTKRRWVGTNDVLAVPYDIPIPGYQNDTVNTLRLWSASATDEFNLAEFNAGSYADAVGAKNAAEHITMVLYPNDASESGKELRLRQQYFLASASLQDVLQVWVARHGADFSQFAAKNCFQLNDTHPSFAIPELMRLLLDEYQLDWDTAWTITRSTMAYTNHTLLPEALEKWPVRLFKDLLPRLLEIIYEINAHFLNQVSAHWPGDIDRRRRMSLIEEGSEPQVRMAYLAIVGSFSVNGVAELHSNLLTQGLFRDFHQIWPQHFNNKTNGVTPRRWLAGCNPGLGQLITEAIGTGWVRDLARLEALTPLAEDSAFRERWQQVKAANKQRLAHRIQTHCGVGFDPQALFDVQVKRIHEYKRQLLNALHIVYLYDRIKQGYTQNWTPRCVIIGGKAAPGYQMAKRIIKFINSVAEVINRDLDCQPWLRVLYMPNYGVSVMEQICPATDLSEQISTAGKEASGTGNMKFMMNGALTIGTLDGANIEIRQAVGPENFFLFGMSADEVEQTRPHYNPRALIESDAELGRIFNLLYSGQFNPFEPGLFDPIIDALLSPHDPWMTIADLRSYIQAQQQASRAYQDSTHWTRMSIRNCAASGWFSSDRTIGEYNRDIWHLPITPPQA